MKKPLKRVILKLSGEALAGRLEHGIDPGRLKAFSSEIGEIASLGVQVGIVIGGGNIFRGAAGEDAGFDRVSGDYMGMLATVINGLAIQSQLASQGQTARLYTAIPMEPVGQRFERTTVMKAMTDGAVAILTFGTGNPYFTTDTAAALRGVELEADALLKGTRVDGVYDADPVTVPGASRFDRLTFDNAIGMQLKVMDQTAYTLCRENNLPVIVFDMNRSGNLSAIIKGEKVGTIIEN